MRQLATLLVLLSVSLLAARATAEEKSAAGAQKAALEKKFAETLDNVSFVGFFTASDQKPGQLTEEKYVIHKVTKGDGDNWTFDVRIVYGKHNLPVKLKIPVIWAGDTPIISVTKMAIPLLGTFDARVVIYDGQYAGTWKGAGHGGQLFGKIVKNPPGGEKIAPDASGK
jgi:hypothetical protein